MTNTFREITDVLPFKNRCGVIKRDKRLLRHAVLCLPFIEQIVEPVINSILYKFQDDLEFLVNAVNEFYEIFELRDGSNYFEDTFELWTYHNSDPPVPPTNDFEENVTKSMTPEVRINITKIKSKCFTYFQKIVTIIKLNFEEHIKVLCGDLPPPINPFFIMNNLFTNTSAKP